jgi:hypothetical protein
VCIIAADIDDRSLMKQFCKEHRQKRMVISEPDINNFEPINIKQQVKKLFHESRKERKSFCGIDIPASDFEIIFQDKKIILHRPCGK